MTDEVGGLVRGGFYQMFQAGAIVWSPPTGAHISTGGIRVVWGAGGYETGQLGYPTTDEIGPLANGGVHQLFENGEIIWSPTYGAYSCTGGIGRTWAALGYEAGPLGYPVGNEHAVAGGAIVQDFQGGLPGLRQPGPWPRFTSRPAAGIGPDGNFLLTPSLGGP
ncbi:LGFP repeat-containing protein [Pseudarthrobacter sp. P1]|uniref:LGFP repeat-containing protein n=1 Tax=Pseudarthrobacter sp. P1 TaxID=3418418 RepID=UPI003CF2AE59